MEKTKRGRPKTLGLEETKIIKFIRKYDNNDGTFDCWKYNLDINPNGPISTECCIKNK